MSGLPGSVLFACSMNVIRSAIAEALLKALHGTRIYVDSVGIRAGGEADPFVLQVMDEINMDLSQHRPKTFDELPDDFFDLVVSLSPDAHHRAVELTRHSSCELEYWQMFDPSQIEGSREQRLQSYRSVRDQLCARMTGRFPREL